ncbi:MAG: response regulator transcription factor [Chitinophagaceae bacterium]|nr:response regulator transcription factor [Chitinophagaceae bacterium]
MSIRYVLIDDEVNNLENLQFLLQRYCPELEFAGTATSATEGLQLIQTQSPDLVFLDIQMPGKTGFDLLRSVDKINFEVIFVTAYDQYGIQAIKFSALDYLLKPIDIDELKKAVVRATEKITSKQQNYPISQLLAYLQQPRQEPLRIALPTLKEIHYVNPDDIIRCEASDNYTLFFLADGEKIMVSKTLREYADLLKPHNFLRCHQSHLVNIRFVKSLLKEEGGLLQLTDKTKIPVSRQNLEPVKKALLDNTHS